MDPARTDVEIVATQIAEALSNSPVVKTELGEFLRFETEAVSGRNPRTGEAIELVPPKVFNYFLVSPRLFKLVFPASTPEAHLHCLQQERERLQARGFELANSLPFKEVSLSGERFEQMVSTLKGAGQLALPQVGLLKVFAGPSPLIFFKPAE